MSPILPEGRLISCNLFDVCVTDKASVSSHLAKPINNIKFKRKKCFAVVKEAFKDSTAHPDSPKIPSGGRYFWTKHLTRALCA